MIRHAYTRQRVRTPSGGLSRTEQSHTQQCDINRIMAKYVKTGLVDHVTQYEGTYGEIAAMDYQTAQNLIAEQRSVFSELPAAIRKRFDNDPANYLRLVETDEGVEELKLLMRQKDLTAHETEWNKGEEPGKPAMGDEAKPVT